MSDVHRAARIARFRDRLATCGVDAALVWLPAHQHYLTGFMAHIYSRPIFVLVTPKRSTLVVPGLEEHHARSRSVVDEVVAYSEVPGGAPARTTAAAVLDDLLAGLPRSAPVGIEASVLPWQWAQAIAGRGLGVADVGALLYGLREVKDAEEQRLIRLAGRLASVAVRDTLAAFRPGITEPLAEMAGNRAALEEAARDLPDATIELTKILTASGIEKSALPHAATTNRLLTVPDLGIHRRHVAVDRYAAECERTFFVGAPSNEARRMFAVMWEAQEAAAARLAAGVATAEVDRVARDVITRAGYGDFFVHRTGHSIGMEPHELPDLRHGSDRVLEAGMVVTIEPGVYVPGVGGVRHSDTYIVTDRGSECVTFGAKDLEHAIVWQP
jgi:Xaa-Pro dipeptidase